MMLGYQVFYSQSSCIIDWCLTTKTGSGIKILIAFGIRDQHFGSKYAIDNERTYLFTTLWIAKNTRVLFIYTENPEILVGKWNGTYHSIWNVSEMIGYRLNQCMFSFSFLTSQLIQVHFVIVDRLTMILWFFHFAFGQDATLHIHLFQKTLSDRTANGSCRTEIARPKGTAVVSTNLDIWQWKTVFLHALHVHFFIFWHFEDVLVLSMTWNDLFCSCADKCSILSCPKRWFQFNSRIVS